MEHQKMRVSAGSIRAKKYLLGIAVSLVAAFGHQGDAAAAWPEKDITLLVHSGAGSSTDVMARALAQAIENVTDQNVVVVVKGREAMVALQNAEADGYTLSTQTRSFLANLASERSHFPAEDFQWIARLVGESYAYGVLADSKWQSVDDLISDAKTNPGQLKLSTFRSGSTHQIAALALADAMGVEFNVIPYDSGADIVISMLGGNVDVAGTNPGRMFEHIAAGKARALIITADERHDKLPGVPTAQELGYDVSQYHWRGIIGKKGIPESTLKQIDAVMTKAVNDPAFLNYVEKEGLDLLAQDHIQISANVDKELGEVKSMMMKLGLIK